MKVNEAQPVHILSTDSVNSDKLLLLGSVSQKLNPKLELEASKAEVIRQRSQEAEKERLARKTMELDVVLPVNRQKRSITRRPSITSTTTSPSLRPNTTLLSNNNNNSNNNNTGCHSLKTKIIQLLALGPQSLPQLTQKLNVNVDQLKAHLDELSTCSSTGMFALSPEFYSQVKITDWPHYSMRERETVTKNVNLHRKAGDSNFVLAQPVPRSASTSSNNFNLTPPETPETPSKRQFSTQITHQINRNSAPSSAKKPSTAKDRLSAIMKKRKI